MGRAKAKKIKEKYKDQDDEERDLRLILTGSKVTQRIAASPLDGVSGAVGDKTSDQEPPVVPEPAKTQKEVAKPNAEKAAKDSGNQGKVSDSSKRGKGPPDKKFSQRQPIEVLTAGCEMDESADQQLAQLDLLTGQPQPDEEVLYVLPMVAPYLAMGGPYAHRIKLTQGNNKKGQTVKQCLKMLEASVELPGWKQLVQAIPENDVASMLCGTC